MASAQANRRGILLMLVAMACYVGNDVFVKLAAQSLPPGQVLAVRGAFATIFVLAIARGARDGWRAALRPLVSVRCGLEITTALTSVIALSLAPLATVSTLMMTAPLMIAATAMALRWEPWRGGRLWAAAAGFAGVLLVIQPAARPEVPAAGLACALLCAASLAARDLVTRRIPVTIPSSFIAVATTLAVCLAGLLLGLVEHWTPLTRYELGMLAAAAGCAALGNYALIVACRGVDLSVVTPFRYSLVLWALLLGYAIWGDMPRPQAAIGVLLIVAAGAFTVWTARRP
ncbi:drug/metabolite transporter (DMT)-like permease [Variovorax boronicumulans]|uniref:DMT family transporter n=1 Tax=Variovorax boronicumulans TaxID=436515 RepID=UPI00278775D4|nr:DMT family transporter [Variovorax boronicumulans]MDP9995283.1 drug/metabolite transporter (DMT)-like permease [Variovorax boronicumulans]MDQ0006573.1 drug/metabolite transporter (DMT)-like permease [Variovorax boronicumulans]MDQ0044327.1 drug/metabolite transporter (DMT)-like permease [Variovorax boronicumulans]